MLRIAIISLLALSVSGCHQAVKAGPLTCNDAAHSANATVESYLFGVKAGAISNLADYQIVWQNDFWQVYRAKGFAFETCRPQLLDGVQAYPVVRYKDSYQFILGSLVLKVTDKFDTQQLVTLGFPEKEPDRLNRITLIIDGDLDQAINDIQRLIGVEYVYANITKPVYRR